MTNGQHAGGRAQPQRHLAHVRYWSNGLEIKIKRVADPNRSAVAVIRNSGYLRIKVATRKMGYTRKLQVNGVPS
jgi:hypothetical protein